MRDFISVRLTTTNLEDVQRFIQNFGSAAKTSVARALNRSINGVKTDASKFARKEYVVTAMAVRKTFRIYRARNRLLEAAASSSGFYIPLIRFGVRPSVPRHRKPPTVGVSVEKRRGSRSVYAGAFVARMKSGHVGVFRRTGESGRREKNYLEKIKALYGTPVPEMLKDREVRGQIADNARQRFEKNMNHEVDYLLQRMGLR